MNSAFIIRLGSGASVKHNVGAKARWLDLAVRAGLNVPLGVVVLDTIIDLGHLHGAVEQQDTRLRVTDTDMLAALLDLPPFEGRVAVRSAFSVEDAETSSLAGYFQSVLDVDASDGAAIGKALETVWSSARAPSMFDTGEFAAGESRLRRDVLIMEMVTAQVSGVAFSEREYEDDLVEYTTGTSERLTRGMEHGTEMLLPKLRGYERAPLPRDLPPWAVRLQALLRDVRRWLGARDWDVEWADDGNICWLIQLRPITRPTRRDETFTIANHKEVLPPLPSFFMTSVVESCAHDVFGYYRDFDSALPQSRPFIEVFYGRPYINQSLMAEVMRHWGLPTRLVTDNIGGVDDRPFGLNLRRVINRTLSLTLPRQLAAQLLSVQSARRATEVLNAHAANPGGTILELIETARWLYITLVRQMFSLTAACAPMLSILNRAGVLADLDAHHETVSTRKFRAQEAMRAYAASNPTVHEALAGGKLPDDEAFTVLWRDYLAEFGHRGVYESDLSRTRDSEAPESLLRSLANPPLPEIPKPKLGVKARLLWPFWWQAARTMRAREQWRHDVMRGFATVRAALLKQAAGLVDLGALPDCDSFWLLSIDEARHLAGGWRPDSEFWAERRAKIDRLEAMHPPDLIRRFDGPAQASPNGVSRLHGIPLTRGVVSGQAWVLDEPASVLPDGFSRADTVLVARSVDVGWTSTFGLVSGAAVETGGHLSHGSIVLREIGLPAVTNLSGATRAVQTGDMIRLDAGRGTLDLASVTAENGLDTSEGE